MTSTRTLTPYDRGTVVDLNNVVTQSRPLDFPVTSTFHGITPRFVEPFSPIGFKVCGFELTRSVTKIHKQDDRVKCSLPYRRERRQTAIDRWNPSIAGNRALARELPHVASYRGPCFSQAVCLGWYRSQQLSDHSTRARTMGRVEVRYRVRTR